MPSFLRAFESNPFVRLLTAIGGVGGGLAMLYTAYIFISSPQNEISGRLCPILYEVECAADNAHLLDQLNGRIGEVVAIDMRIEWGGLDGRDDICASPEENDLHPGNYSRDVPGWTVMEAAAANDQCDADGFIGFEQSVMANGLIRQNQGGEYVITGDFLVARGELVNERIPATVANAGWFRLQKQ